jgi:hypothetical protein
LFVTNSAYRKYNIKLTIVLMLMNSGRKLL